MRILRYPLGHPAPRAGGERGAFSGCFCGRFIRYRRSGCGSPTGDVLLPAAKLPGFFEMTCRWPVYRDSSESGRPYADSEMVVLRACGTWPSKLAGYVMVLAVIVMIGVAILSLYLAPEYQHERRYY